MAIAPHKVFKLSKKQIEKIDRLEKLIDKELKRKFFPGLEFKYEIKEKLTNVQMDALERRYSDAGWDAVIESYVDGSSTLILDTKLRPKT